MTKKNTRVLIVDDDPPIRALLQRAALGAGFEVESARDGQDAIEKLEYRLYDIVIVDLAAPASRGFQLIEKIGALDPRPTVIASTAMAAADVASVDDSMIRRVIRKPIEVDRVAAALVETAREIAEGSRQISSKASASDSVAPIAERSEPRS